MTTQLAQDVAKINNNVKVMYWPSYSTEQYRVCVRSRRRGRPYHTHSTHDTLADATAEAERVAQTASN